MKSLLYITQIVYNVHTANFVNDFYFVSAGSNIVGKFTQSVRRIVQDVKDEGTASTLQN